MRDDRTRLKDMLEAIERIRRQSDKAAMLSITTLVQTWIVHHLQILGEAVWRVVERDLGRWRPIFVVSWPTPDDTLPSRVVYIYTSLTGAALSSRQELRLEETVGHRSSPSCAPEEAPCLLICRR